MDAEDLFTLHYAFFMSTTIRHAALHRPTEPPQLLWMPKTCTYYTTRSSCVRLLDMLVVRLHYIDPLGHLSCYGCRRLIHITLHRLDMLVVRLHYIDPLGHLSCYGCRRLVHTTLHVLMCTTIRHVGCQGCTTWTHWATSVAVDAVDLYILHYTNETCWLSGCTT
ncbi:hypothetical protein J6590_062261 [Homalodisca vitripennis]|nr:hypothetical protein J6590_062261 [Homalodisca vitripennis]